MRLESSKVHRQRAAAAANYEKLLAEPKTAEGLSLRNGCACQGSGKGKRDGGGEGRPATRSDVNLQKKPEGRLSFVLCCVLCAAEVAL